MAVGIAGQASGSLSSNNNLPFIPDETGIFIGFAPTKVRMVISAKFEIK
ncbi:MAG: hypothetical protein LC113_08495 [Acidobacteria bacterium]|nr:hypothetical protein [Acidobacteriota bacterium]